MIAYSIKSASFFPAGSRNGVAVSVGGALEVIKPEDEAIHSNLVFWLNNEVIAAMVRIMGNSGVKKRIDSVPDIQKFILQV